MIFGLLKICSSIFRQKFGLSCFDVQSHPDSPNNEYMQVIKVCKDGQTGMLCENLTKAPFSEILYRNKTKISL